MVYTHTHYNIHDPDKDDATVVVSSTGYSMDIIHRRRSSSRRGHRDQPLPRFQAFSTSPPGERGSGSNGTRWIQYGRTQPVRGRATDSHTILGTYTLHFNTVYAVFYIECYHLSSSSSFFRRLRQVSTQNTTISFQTSKQYHNTSIIFLFYTSIRIT